MPGIFTKSDWSEGAKYETDKGSISAHVTCVLTHDLIGYTNNCGYITPCSWHLNGCPKNNTKRVLLWKEI